MSVQHYRQLIAWQKAMDLAETVYRVSRIFPRDELYSLTSQVRRAAVSVPSNIAEGQGRWSTKEFIHFLGNANGSLQETETQLLLAHRFQYVNDEQLTEVLDLSAEVGRILHGLAGSLRNRDLTTDH